MRRRDSGQVTRLGSFWNDDRLRVFSLTTHVLTLAAWWRGVPK